MAASERKYPLRRPANHQLPMPRWKLLFDESIHDIFTAYIGLQHHSRNQPSNAATAAASEILHAWINDSELRPHSFEIFKTIDDHEDLKTTVWVCYWENAEIGQQKVKTLDLRNIHAAIDAKCRDTIGLWYECFASAVARLETNYSGLDYLPGLARLPHSQTEEHTLSAYWGAARDRIPDSSHDDFPPPSASSTSVPSPVPAGLGQHLKGTTFENLVHIRSGQFWANCGDVEREAYESKLEPTLRAGLRYLLDNPAQTGSYGLRYLRNTDLASVNGERRETCVTSFFRNLQDLEKWSKSHRSHLAIYKGAIDHAKSFGSERRFRTWHEISVLKEGEANFEYLNCTPDTGVISYLPLDVV